MDPIDAARAFFRALNDGDVDAIAALYDDRCVLEHAFLDHDDVVVGVEAARSRWAAELARFQGALPGGHRAEVTRAASVETGWGWARAEWTAAVIEDGSDYGREFSGYTDFWVEEGRIKRQRTRLSDRGRVTSLDRHTRSPASVPVAGVGAVIVADDGRVVLVKRVHEPLAGQWSLPGGKLEFGETLEAGIAREVREETGLIVDVGPVVEVFDRILLGVTGAVQHHFVLVDYLCRIRGGHLQAGSDVSDAVLASRAQLTNFRLTDKAHAVVLRALELARSS